MITKMVMISEHVRLVVRFASLNVLFKLEKAYALSLVWLVLASQISPSIGKAFPGAAVPETKDSSLVVCFGEMLIDFVPTINGLSLADAPAFKKAPGGAPANVAVGIARLGGSSAFIGKVWQHWLEKANANKEIYVSSIKWFRREVCYSNRFCAEVLVFHKVGEDEFGYMLADILKENNVNNEGMRFDPGARTALAFVTLRSDGEREFMFYRNPSADMLLQENELDFDLIRKAFMTGLFINTIAPSFRFFLHIFSFKYVLYWAVTVSVRHCKAKIFHYGSISLITEPCKSAHIAAAKAAKDAGVVLSYDPNLRLPLWPSAESAREGILSIWDTADIIKISEEEISFLTQGEDPYDDAVVRKLFHPNLKLLLVTEGPDGCRYYTKEFSGRVKGLKVEAVDTTGAGDAFVAGTLTQLASDLSLLQDEDRLRDALHFANVCGALTVTERGAIPALPTREAVLNTSIYKSVA
ncbi:Carbohydrate kinase PfkB [Corchorus olitorius]|uniref:Carbohydrate kinase PfkB n=1 Tax=Corchorus olitorius TaxID=93759 RepID=A0A1R3JLE2_9ROSI|nr:Carbohydrate kinase PfkB [Corchorus olitorius]